MRAHCARNSAQVVANPIQPDPSYTSSNKRNDLKTIASLLPLLVINVYWIYDLLKTQNAWSVKINFCTSCSTTAVPLLDCVAIQRGTFTIPLPSVAASNVRVSGSRERQPLPRHTGRNSTATSEGNHSKPQHMGYADCWIPNKESQTLISVILPCQNWGFIRWGWHTV